MKNVLGAQLYTVREHTQTISDFARTLEKVAKIGYTAVQISGAGPLDPKEMGKLCADQGLTVAATHMGWDRFLHNLDEVIETHKAWNCTHTAIGGLFGPEYLSLEGLQRFLHELVPIAERLAQEGMDFSYHNHNHEFIRYGARTWMAELIERSKPEQLKLELDTYWVQAGGGDPAAWVRKCAGRIPLLHLKDMIITTGREQRFAEVGEGNLNWPAILESAQASGVVWYLVEQDNCYGSDPFEALATSYRNLRAMGLS